MSVHLIQASSFQNSTNPRTNPPSPLSIHHHHHFLSQRTYIPSHIYEHPSALLLERCNSLKELYRILPFVFKSALYDEHLFRTKLISLFCSYGSLADAARVFEPIEDKADALYHTMLKGYAKFSSLEDALKFFCRIRSEDVSPVVYNFTYLLKVCGDEADLKRGKEIHAQLVTSGFSLNLFAMTALQSMYAKCRSIEDARNVFDRLPERDLVSWNTMIAGYAQNGLANVALELVSRIHEEDLRPDIITSISILPAAADLGSLRIGKEIHSYILRSGFSSLVNVSAALVGMYSKCGSVEKARALFGSMRERDAVSWNSMIDGYVQSDNPEEAMVIFQKMLDAKVKPTDVTIMGVLHACADLGDLERGKSVHKLVVELDLESNIWVMNSLISMYCKCKEVAVAADIFSNLQDKTVVSWNTMILGFGQSGRAIEALECFREMQSRNIKPDTFTMVSVVTAVAELSAMRQAKWVHGLVLKNHFEKNVFVMTALVDMYAKCGAVQAARRVFDMMDERHTATWNAMIDGYGMHGFGNAAIELFNTMLKGIIRPNKVTFLCVISACSHSGMVEEGFGFFNMMKKEYCIEPSMDHYGAMVDLLGRAGQLNRAWDFIEDIPVRPAINVYGAILGACRIHKNIELAEKAADKIFELHPDEAGYHVLLMNVYRSASRWDKVAEVRIKMEKQGLKKLPGCSLVEVRNEIHSFYSGSTRHSGSKKIYAYIENLMKEIKKAGYVPDTDAIHDVEDEVKEQLLSSHSEKLAIAFGILNTRPGSTIHIRKNLRVCGDCHTATKYISLVTGREIIVRDMQRFHHFKNGTCSCGDYW